jgi:hypothetical protein
MSAVAVSQFLYLLEEAFQGPGWHSFLENLRSPRPEDWTWVPPGGRRSIRDIVQHVGSCKVMYHNHAFGDAQLTWDEPLVEGGDALSTISSAIGWLREGQERLRRSIAALDDAEFLRPRMTNWDDRKETRWIITLMCCTVIEAPASRSLLPCGLGVLWTRWIMQRTHSSSARRQRKMWGGISEECGGLGARRRRSPVDGCGSRMTPPRPSRARGLYGPVGLPGQRRP